MLDNISLQSSKGSNLQITAQSPQFKGLIRLELIISFQEKEKLDGELINKSKQKG